MGAYINSCWRLSWVEGRDAIAVPNQKKLPDPVASLWHLVGGNSCVCAVCQKDDLSSGFDLMLTPLACVRREAFEPMMESGELVVRYRARRTYSRRTAEATREFPRPCLLHVGAP